LNQKIVTTNKSYRSKSYGQFLTALAPATDWLKAVVPLKGQLLGARSSPPPQNKLGEHQLYCVASSFGIIDAKTPNVLKLIQIATEIKSGIAWMRQNRKMVVPRLTAAGARSAGG
jgi:hypothetical protein